MFEAIVVALEVIFDVFDVIPVTSIFKLVNPDPSPTKAEADTVPEVWTKVVEVLPNCMVFDDETLADEPMAIALIKEDDVKSECQPIVMFWDPVTFVSPDPLPILIL